MGDIGASALQRKRVNDTIMDDFFRQLNGTTTHVNEAIATRLNRKNFSSYNKTAYNKTTSDFQSSNNTASNMTNSPVARTQQRNHQSSLADHLPSNVSRTNGSDGTQKITHSSFTDHNFDMTKSVGSNQSITRSPNTGANKSNSHAEFTLRRHSISRAGNVKKSAIPHPPSVRNPSYKQVLLNFRILW